MTAQLVSQQIRTKPLSFENYSEAERFLERRHTSRYEIRGINGIKIHEGKVFFDFKLREEGSATSFSREVYVPKYAFQHLCQFIDIPSAVLDYFVSLNTQLDGEEQDIAIANESDHLYALFKKRLSNDNNRDIYLHITEDGFGTFARCISSDQYIHYEDKQCLQDFQELVDGFNRQNDTEYNFSMARLTPYEILIGYVSETEQIYGEAVAKGISQYNSEAKKRSVHFMNMLIRLLCSNGLYSRHGGGQDIRIPHTGDNFDNQREDAFNTVINTQNGFFNKIKSLEQYDSIISEDWDNFIEMPSKYIPMRNGDKREIIEIAKDEGYPFNVWGIINALTYKATHEVEDQNESDLLNKKAMKVVDYARDINELILPIEETVSIQ